MAEETPQWYPQPGMDQSLVNRIIFENVYQLRKLSSGTQKVVTETVQQVSSLASSGSSSGGAVPPVTVIDVVATANLTITLPVVVGYFAFVRITQDATGGHVITWDTMFVDPPIVPTVANLVTTALFVGIGTGWINVSVIGRHK
jgi:hypothetical protein